MGPFTDDLLQNKVVLITGGATGLGRAMERSSRALALNSSYAGAGRKFYSRPLKN